MFGYVLPCKPELKVREWTRYRAYYCGLCKELGREYGLFSRFLLNYDLVLLALCADTARGEAPTACSERCIASAAKHPVLPASAGTRLAASALALTAYYKLADDLHDDPFFRRLPKWCLRPFIGHFRRRAAKVLPQADEVFRTASTEQAALEKRGCQNEDEAAEPTALMTQALFDAAAPQGAGHTDLARMGYFLGKILYYLDAAQDFEADEKAGAYNVFRLRGLDMPAAHSRAKTLCRLCAAQLAQHYTSACAALPGLADPIVQNIFFLGLPGSIARAGLPAQRKPRPAA